MVGFSMLFLLPLIRLHDESHAGLVLQAVQVPDDADVGLARCVGGTLCFGRPGRSQ